MTELLNQQAIDNIFATRTRPDDGGSALASDVAPPMTYNFRQPFRLGPAAQRRLETVQSTFVQGLRRVLAVQLRMPVEVAVETTELADLAEFSLSLGTPGAAYAFPVGRHDEGRGIFDWELETAFAFIDRLLGGNGTPIDWTRPLTPIEEGLIRVVTERSLTPLRQAWKDVLPIGTALHPFEASQVMPGPGSPENRVLVTLVTIKAEPFAGKVSIALPWTALEPLLDERPAGRKRAPERMPAGEVVLRKVAGTAVGHSHLTVAARLPAALVNVGVLRRLSPGQVLDTGHAMETPVELHVNGRSLFQGSLGQARGHVVVRVEDQVSRSEPDRLAYSRKGRVI